MADGHPRSPECSRPREAHRAGATAGSQPPVRQRAPPRRRTRDGRDDRTALGGGPAPRPRGGMEERDAGPPRPRHIRKRAAPAGAGDPRPDPAPEGASTPPAAPLAGWAWTSGSRPTSVYPVGFRLSAATSSESGPSGPSAVWSRSAGG